MLSKNHPIILFIDRFGFGVYQDVLTNLPKFNFTPDLVTNLDVVNKDQLMNLIGTFIQINKMIPSSLAVVLSDNVIYIKDLVNPTPKPAQSQNQKADTNEDKDHEVEVQNFLENIPFEEVLAKVIKVGNMNRVVAVNKDLVMAIIDVFVSKGFAIDALVPGFMYGQNVNFTTGLTESNIRVILEDAITLKLGNLLTGQEKIIPVQGLESELKSMPAKETKKPKNLRQYLLLAVFAILSVVLVVVYLSQSVPPKSPSALKTKSGTTVDRVNTTPIVIPTLTQESTTIVPVDLRTVIIKISHSQQQAAVAASLKSGLSGIGYQNVLDEISEASIPEKSSVIFSQNIPADLRNNIIVEIRKTLPYISILENQDVNSTISILIGKS